jgi:release factor glutamine methyltransferase
LLQKVFRKLFTLFYKPVLASYLQKARVYYYKPFKLTILPGVFHPAFFFSTKFLLNYLNQIDFKNKSVVEVGSGNGLIAFNLALKAKSVLALELSQVAVNGLFINLENNISFLPKNVLKIVHSNLFQKIDTCVFNYIIVNPPYYPNIVNNEKELAWNCGPDFEYFEDFFNQVSNFMSLESKIIMVLSDQCNINKIKKIATNKGFTMELVKKKKFLIEDNYIFEFKHLQNSK